MFYIVCLIYFVIVLYSLIYQLRVVINYKKYKNLKIKDASGLFVSKSLLNENNIGTLYVTKIKNKYNDHYDIERNVIRLTDEVYEEETLSSMAIATFQVIKAIVFKDKSKSKENKYKFLVMDIANKISFILFIIAASSVDLPVMMLSLLIMLIVIGIKYTYIEKYNNLIEENIDILKKEYKLKKENLSILNNYLNILIMNELSIHLLNNKY